MEKIAFLGPIDEQSGFLSNLYRSPFLLDDVLWPTVEHAYQTTKFTDAAYAESIRNPATPLAAKTMGQRRYYPLHADWESSKQQVMLRLVAAKFCLHGSAELMARLLKTKGKLLIDASPTDSYWGVGADGQGSNHLGRILMALRDVLLQCDHANMQATPSGDAHTLHTRVVAEASTLLSDPQWDPAYRAPGLHLHVLSVPLFGQGINDLRERLRPWLGVPLAACWGEHSFACPGLVLQAKAPDIASGGMPHGLLIHQQTSRRLGYLHLHTVGIQAADADWREPATAILPMPSWKNFLDGGHGWALQAVSVIRTACQDDKFNHFQYFQPAAQAMLLAFSSCLSADMPDGDEGAWRYVALYAAHDDGFAPQVQGYEANPASDIGTPYGAPWELLLCTESMGALPKIEAAFAAHFTHEGIELPTELVVNRRACQSMDDGLDHVTAWNIDVAFGRDEQGEYLDMDSCHRMRGENYVRFHEDGRTTRREDAIEPQRFEVPVTVMAEQSPATTGASAAVAPDVLQSASGSRILLRVLGFRSQGTVYGCEDDADCFWLALDADAPEQVLWIKPNWRYCGPNYGFQMTTESVVLARGQLPMPEPSQLQYSPAHWQSLCGMVLQAERSSTIYDPLHTAALSLSFTSWTPQAETGPNVPTAALLFDADDLDKPLTMLVNDEGCLGRWALRKDVQSFVASNTVPTEKSWVNPWTTPPAPWNNQAHLLALANFRPALQDFAIWWQTQTEWPIPLRSRLGPARGMWKAVGDLSALQIVLGFQLIFLTAHGGWLDHDGEECGAAWCSFDGAEAYTDLVKRLSTGIVEWVRWMAWDEWHALLGPESGDLYVNTKHRWQAVCRAHMAWFQRFAEIVDATE